MRSLRVKAGWLALVVCLMLWGIKPVTQAAEKELHWDALDVEARLDAGGVLDVIERHTMVFTGDWNGGEREFNLRPRQKIEFLALDRIDTNTGARKPLLQSPVPSNVDEFVWSDTRTLHWRSRLPTDAPFADTRLIYELHYKLSGILLKDEKVDQQYLIDHDFAFPKRVGPIARFSLRLALDPVWKPLSEVRDRYTAGPIEPGRSFVLKIPIRYSGAGVPAALDGGRSPAVVGAALGILGIFGLIVFAFFVRERAMGRFDRIDEFSVDGKWIDENILSHPAEVVGAAWDGRIGTPEVVALIARMTAEGKLESEVGGSDSMTLRLKVDRSKLDGHERALVDSLFFGDRAETSTKAIQQHYKSRGFVPANVIMPKLQNKVNAVLSPGAVRVGKGTGIALFIAGALLLVWTSYSQPELGGGAVAAFMVFLVLGGLLQIPGWVFRSRIDWGQGAALLCMIPAFLVCLGLVSFFGLVVSTGLIELPLTMVGGLAAWVICISNASINGMRSRQNSAAIAFRKRLAAGRRFFMNELAKPHPALRDSWYPWVLAFGLGKQVDVWSTRHVSTSTGSSEWDRSSSHSSSGSSSSSSSSTNWTGGGGLSGGAGATGVWAAAAAGMAVGVSAPSSSSSSGGGSSSSSSSGGSSGGGGGGGW